MSLNVSIFSGYVNRLEVSGSEQGKNLVAKFTLSVRKSYIKDENKKYNFVNAVAFGSIAKIIADRVKEGDMLEICCEYITDSYVDQNGQTRYSHSFRVDKVSLCPNGNSNNESQQPSNYAPAPPNGNAGYAPAEWSRRLCPAECKHRLCSTKCKSCRHCTATVRKSGTERSAEQCPRRRI